ncbi:hypothetical protein DRQ09_00915 [candidate division KSB1 bacterium]|mgnify:CR=1 FL=1|nr:MAG: hypothetical protein DRQ09_00915 [candidate division KSB1 bacterium]
MRFDRLINCLITNDKPMGLKMSIKRTFVLIVFSLIFLTFAAQSTSQIVRPEEFLGFKVGEDYKLASWKQIYTYFNMLDDASDKITVKELGKSTEGRPFIMAIISSEENMKNLMEYKSISRKLANPGGMSEKVAKGLSEKGKLILLITCSIHATEVGAAQMSVELTYRLLTEKSPRVKRILNDVIFLLVPSFNPDGLEKVRTWYEKYLETPFEASPMPYLYHTYTGHDNNRDAYMLTQVESRLVNRILYKEWFPQVYLDEHQMGNRGARLFVPPFCDPINPNVDPLIWRETALLGEHIAVDLESKGFSGVITGAFYTGWWQGAFLMTAWYHNCVGLLTEMASCKIASPVFQRKSELKGRGRGLPSYDKYMNFPNPWPGGWWKLRNIVDYELNATLSLLDACSEFRSRLLYNFYLMNKRAIEKGKKEPPFAFVIPPNQWDDITALKMIDVLKEGGVKIYKTGKDFIADGVNYPSGTFVVPMSQPYRAFAKDMLEPQRYPDIRLYPGGPPVRPYDFCGWTLPYQMNVNTVQVDNPFDAELIPVRKVEYPEGKVENPHPDYAFVLSHKTNNSIIATNRLLKKGFEVYWSKGEHTAGNIKIHRGDLVIPVKAGLLDELQSITKELYLNFYGIDERVRGKGYLLKPFRLGVYQPWTASMSEGWSRWVFEKFEIEYKNIHNSEIKAGKLNDRYDVIYIPDIRAEGILKGREEGTVPPLFAKGIGNQGLYNLKEFVENGGTLITLNSASDLLTGEFKLPVINILKGKKPEEFFCPGSILSVKINNSHPVGYGMPEKVGAFFARSPAFKVIPSFNVEANIIAMYPDRNPLMSGWILGEKTLFNKAALVEIPFKKGRAILIGFNAIQRAQAYGTFKLLFNSFNYSTAELTVLP